MAANSTAKQPKHRISFAKLREPLQAPNLLGLQVESFDWLLGNDAWKARVEAAQASAVMTFPTSPASKKSSTRFPPSRTSQAP